MGFVELGANNNGEHSETTTTSRKAGVSPASKSRIHHTNKSWPIGEKLKNEKAEDLFLWIGECIAEVVEDELKTWSNSLLDDLPMGVTFSFPMMYAGSVCGLLL